MTAPLLLAVRVSVIAAALTVVFVRPGAAQATVDSFDQLSQVLKKGNTVFVQDETGARTKGRITELSSTSIQVMTSRESGRAITFAANQVTRVSKVDSRLNGFLIGVVAGAVPGLLAGHWWNTYFYNEGGERSPISYLAFGGPISLIGGGIGFAIDGALDGQTLVFARRGAPARARVAPMFGDHLAGVRVSLTF